MSPDEHRMLTTFLNQLDQVGPVSKDTEAAALIANSVARQPDAAYLLVQRALLQDQAINVARERIASLETQLRTALSNASNSLAPSSASSGSFLDSGNNAWGRSAGSASARTVAVGAPQFTQAPSQVTAAQPVAAASPGFLGGGGGSFLTSMAATAAGVAGGAFLYQGISSMMHSGGAANAMGQGASPFGSMANSVDHAAAAPAAAPIDTSTNTPSAAFDDSGYNDVASDDSGAGSDDSFA